MSPHAAAQLIVFGGLPGVGKTTLARGTAQILRAVYLRVDTIEQAVLRTHPAVKDIGPTGYLIAQDLARDQLRSGLSVVIDCVNPLPVTRNIWRDLGMGEGARLLDIEVACSDQKEHRRRIETRTADIQGHALPTWDDVVARNYAPWDRPHIVVDTAKLTAQEALDQIMKAAQTRP